MSIEFTYTDFASGIPSALYNTLQTVFFLISLLHAASSSQVLLFLCKIYNYCICSP